MATECMFLTYLPIIVNRCGTIVYYAQIAGHSISSKGLKVHPSLNPNFISEAVAITSPPGSLSCKLDSRAKNRGGAVVSIAAEILPESM